MVAYYVPHIDKSRVVQLSYPKLVECQLCNGILWKPIACSECEKPFCESCIAAWQKEKQNAKRCPEACSSYSERPCPPANLYILRKLQIACRYASRQCHEILEYEQLEGHEKICGCLPMVCPGCGEEVDKQEFDRHTNTCLLVELKCSECDLTYRRELASEHTEIKCMREQLQQLRRRTQAKEQEHKVRIDALEVQITALNASRADR